MLLLTKKKENDSFVQRRRFEETHMFINQCRLFHPTWGLIFTWNEAINVLSIGWTTFRYIKLALEYQSA
jgi:hypothetical protein